MGRVTLATVIIHHIPIVPDDIPPPPPPHQRPGRRDPDRLLGRGIARGLDQACICGIYATQAYLAHRAPVRACGDLPQLPVFASRLMAFVGPPVPPLPASRGLSNTRRWQARREDRSSCSIKLPLMPFWFGPLLTCCLFSSHPKPPRHPDYSTLACSEEAAYTDDLQSAQPESTTASLRAAVTPPKQT